MESQMSHPDPLVSVIMPAYNAKEYISEAIQSVLHQTYGQWELILVDDGSTDQTKKVINPFLEDERIRYIYQENGGQGRARNKAINQAKGIYLALLDDDDVWDEHMLQSQLNIILHEEDYLVFSKLQYIASDVKPS